MKNALKALLITTLFAIAGCGGQSILPSDPDTQFALQYVFMKTTGEIVKDDPEKAQRVREIAAEIRKYADNEALLSVDGVLAVIRDAINWDRLDAADTEMANYLLDRWRRSLIERFGEEALAEDIRISVATVTEWAILAARP